MKDDLLRFNKQQKYIIFDTETEGLNLVHSKPWQIAWIVAQGDNILEKFDIYIKWEDLKVSEGAAKVTGFSNEYYKRNAIDATEAFNKFSKYLYDPQYKLIGQNVLGFDVYMINIWRKFIGLNPDYSFIDRIIDTRCLAMAIAKQIPPPKYDPVIAEKSLISWQYRLLNHKDKSVKASQLALLKKYSIDFDEKKLHDALYDVEMTYKIFKKQLFEIEL
jgi:DNA polymerase III epsilon subunit-like protein